MKNKFAIELTRDFHRRMHDARVTTAQMCKDAAMIAANEVLKLGAGRAPAFSAAFDKALREIAKLTVEDTPDLEYAKTKLDDRLKRICGENFVPWEERYGGVE